MPSLPNLIHRFCLCLLALAPAVGAAAETDVGSAEVRAVLFYDARAPQSRELFGFYLPALFEQYGARLEVAGVDVSQVSGVTLYGAAAERLGLPPRPDERPVVVVGESSWIGLVAIAQRLGDQFEDLAKQPGAAQWPVIAGLQERLPEGIQDVAERVAREGVSPASAEDEGSDSGTLPLHDRIANALAVLVLVGMVVALAHSFVRLRRQDAMAGGIATLALLVTLVVGLGISGYTAYTALANVAPMCGPIGSCAAVQNSEYAKLFGVPMGVLGLIGYSLILFSWLLARRRSPRGGGWYWLPWAIALFGVLFSIRLTALEPFVIGATCVWCLGSAVSITATLWLLSGYPRVGQVNPKVDAGQAAPVRGRR